MLVVAVQRALSCRQHKGPTREAFRNNRGGTPAAMQDAVTTIAVTTESRGDERWRAIARNIFPFVVVGTIWEIVALAGVFPHRLFPTIEEVAATFIRLTMAGILPHHAIQTVIRLLSGFTLAALIGVTVGVLMGRSRRA